MKSPLALLGLAAEHMTLDSHLHIASLGYMTKTFQVSCCICFAGLLLAFASLAPTEAQTSQDNTLIDNGSFESGDAVAFEQSYEQSWVYFKIAGDPQGAIDRTTKQEGNRSYRFDLGTSSRAYLHSQPFTVEPGVRYTISCWVKAENAAPESVFARIFWFKDKIGVAASEKFADTRQVGRTFGWQRLEKTVQAPSDANTAYIRLEPNSGNLEVGGEKLFFESDDPVRVWFDNVTVRKSN